MHPLLKDSKKISRFIGYLSGLLMSCPSIKLYTTL